MSIEDFRKSLASSVILTSGGMVARCGCLHEASDPDWNSAARQSEMTALPSYIDPQVWTWFVENRKSMKKVPFTDGAKILVIRKLMKLHQDGYDANAHLEKAVENGWRTVYQDEKLKQGKSAANKDPALVKIEQDDLKAAPMPQYIRELKERLVR